MPLRHQLELYVLIAIGRVGEGAYAGAIHRDIEDVIAGRVSVAAVYNALDRLEQQGLVRSSQSEPRAEPGGRSRRQFLLTAAGKEMVRRERAFAARLWQSWSPASSDRRR